MKHKNILLTGFEPFADFRINPSAELMKFLEQRGFQTAVLPVSYSLIDSKISSLKLDSYDFIFLFGLAAGRSQLSFERVALNWIEGKVEDNSGQKPLPQPIDSSQPAAFINQLPLDQWVIDGKDLDLDLQVSTDAGAYLCNYLYFQVMKVNTHCIFIHIPGENDFAKIEKLIERLITRLFPD